MNGNIKYFEINSYNIKTLLHRIEFVSTTERPRALDNLDRFYVLDVHKDETVFLSEPTFSIPECKGNKSRMPTNIKRDIQPI